VSSGFSILYFYNISIFRISASKKPGVVRILSLLFVLNESPREKCGDVPPK
jgi:hypothetical protein